MRDDFARRSSQRGHVHDYGRRRSERKRAGAVFSMIHDGKLNLRIEHIYSLDKAQQAHRDLEGRKTTGKLLLIPN